MPKKSRVSVADLTYKLEGDNTIVFSGYNIPIDPVTYDKDQTKKKAVKLVVGVQYVYEAYNTIYVAYTLGAVKDSYTTMWLSAKSTAMKKLIKAAPTVAEGKDGTKYKAPIKEVMEQFAKEVVKDAKFDAEVLKKGFINVNPQTLKRM